MTEHLRQRRRRSQLRPQASLQLDEIIDSWGLTQTGDYPISQADIQEFHQLRVLKNEIEKRLDNIRATFCQQLADTSGDIQPGPFTIQAVPYHQQALSRATLEAIVGRREARRIFDEIPPTRHVKLKVWENGARPR